MKRRAFLLAAISAPLAPVACEPAAPLLARPSFDGVPLRTGHIFISGYCDSDRVPGFTAEVRFGA